MEQMLRKGTENECDMTVSGPEMELAIQISLVEEEERKSKEL
jgi:hypothetical protein